MSNLRMEATVLFCKVDPEGAAEFIENLRTTLDNANKITKEWAAVAIKLGADKPAIDVCKWTIAPNGGSYKASCNGLYTGAYLPNLYNYNHCAFCGRKIEVK